MNSEQGNCSPCHYTCTSCVGPNPNDCKFCDAKTRTFTNISFNSLFLCNIGACLCDSGFYDDTKSVNCFGK